MIPSDQFEVKEIIAERTNKKNIKQYRIWWKHYSKSDSTWVNVNKLNCPTALSEWKYKQRQLESKRIKEEEEYIPEVPNMNNNNINNNYFKYTRHHNQSHQSYNNKVKSDTSKVESKLQSIKYDTKINSNKFDPPDDDDPSDDDDDDADDNDDNDPSLSRERNNPLQYLIPYLKLREKLYPISDMRYQKLYTGRYSLLDIDWRMSEVYRFGLLVDFDTNLYSSVFRQYYDILRVNRQLEPKYFKRVRVNSISEKSLPNLVVTYSGEDMNTRGGSHVQDFNLTEKSTTLLELPAILRKHPPNWSSHKIMNDPPTFSELVSKRLDEEVYDNNVKQREGLQKLSAVRAIKIHGEQIPKLEHDQFNISENPEINSINNNLDFSSAKHNFIKNELKRDTIIGQFAAEQNLIFKHILSEVSMELRGAIISELNKRQHNGSENRFSDKTLLKRPPTPKELFTGKDMTQAPTTLYYILVNIAKYDFNVGESISFIEGVFSEDALIWFHSLQTDILSQRYENQIYRFVSLFKDQYMNQAMSTLYEKQVRNCKLQIENPRAVDIHFNLFTKLASCWRACDYTILDNKLVHMYFSNLPIDTQRTIGVDTMKTCKNVSDLYVKVKETATMISKFQPRTYDRDIVSVNSMHMNNNNYKKKYNKNYQNNYTHFNSYNHHNDYRSESASDSDNDNNEINNEPQPDIFDDTQYNYTYPTEAELCDEVSYNDDIDTIYFNATNISKDYYSRDIKCFHCGETGHRAGWFCPLVRLSKEQAPRGAAAYAEFQKKYAKEIRPYNIKNIVAAEKSFWESKGKDIRELVQNKSSKNYNNNNYRSKNSNNKYSKSSNNDKSKASQPISSENLRAKILAHRERLKSKAREITEIDNSDTEKDNDEVQVVNSNSLHTYTDDAIEYVEVPSYTIHFNSITNHNITDNDNEELAIIHKLTQIEKKYAYPLLVQVELNDIKQNVLLDQGATRNICRKTILDKYYPNIYHDILPGKCAVISSSGTMIPIKSRVKLSVRVSENEYQDTVFYVVSNTYTKDIIASFVLGRTFLSMSGLCYDNENDVLFNKSNINKIYMKVLNGKISTLEQEECQSDIIPLCTTIVDNDNNTNVNFYSNDIINKTIDMEKKVPSVEKVPTYISDVINNNKKKNYLHKTKIQERYNKKKQNIINKQLKNDKIIDTVKNHLNSEINNNRYTNDMKDIMLNYIQTNIEKFELIDNNDMNTKLLSIFNHNNVIDKNVIKEEKQSRVNSYMKAYDQTKNHKEGGIIIDQLLQILNEKDSDNDDDAVMKNINDINELAAPSKQADTPELKQQKLTKLHEMVKDISSINDEQKQELEALLSEYIDVYSLSGENFKQTDIVEHEINLEPDIKPFHQRLRVYSPALQQIIDTEVNKMIQDNIVIPSTSPFASNLLLVRKPDPSSPGGTKNRVCVNFIQLNKLTIKDRYPLPNQQDIFRQIGSAKYFTTMDLMSGFWQIAIKPEHRHKTAFITTRGLYEFLVMPFGLCNAPSTFQRMMDRIIKPEWRTFIQTYIDDIILYSKTFEDHLKHLKTLHQVLKENKLTVKLSKCHFGRTSVKFLGHVLSEGAIKPNPEKIQHPTMISRKLHSL